MTGSRVLVALRVPASQARAFAAFTEEIGDWWRHDGLFAPDPTRRGRLAFEPGPGGRLIETYPDGDVFEVGRVKVWDPPRRLVLSWRQATFAPEQETELHVRFDDLGDAARVTVEHHGWDTIPQAHAARHGFPLAVFQLRWAEWWQRLLGRLGEAVTTSSGGPPAGA